MTNDNAFSNMNGGDDSSQFVLSYELLTLLRWLVEHEQEKLKKLIEKSLTAGLREELKRPDFMSKHDMAENARYSVVEFFAVLESLLSLSQSEHAVKIAAEKNLLPALDHIDVTMCDTETVRTGLEKTTNRLKDYPQQNPHDILFEEILRNWKPGKKELLN